MTNIKNLHPCTLLQGATLFSESERKTAHGTSIIDHAVTVITRVKENNERPLAQTAKQIHRDSILESRDFFAVHTKTPTMSLPVYDNNGVPLRMHESPPKFSHRHSYNNSLIDEYCSCDCASQDPYLLRYVANSEKSYSRFGHVHVFTLTCPVCGWRGRVEQNNKLYAIPFHEALPIRRGGHYTQCDGVYEIVTSKLDYMIDVEVYKTDVPYHEFVPDHWTVYNKWTGKYLIDGNGTEDPDADKAYWFKDRQILAQLLATKSVDPEWLVVHCGSKYNRYVYPDIDYSDPKIKAWHRMTESVKLPGYDWDGIKQVYETAPYAIIEDNLVADVVRGEDDKTTACSIDTKRKAVPLRWDSEVTPGWTFDGIRFVAPR